jgi:hypothetical protein
MDRMATVEVAAMLGRSPGFVENLIDSGAFPAHHRSFYPDFTVSSVRTDHVMAYLSRNYVALSARAE